MFYANTGKLLDWERQITDPASRQRGHLTETRQQISENNLRTESNNWSQVLEWARYFDVLTVSCNVNSTSTIASIFRSAKWDEHGINMKRHRTTLRYITEVNYQLGNLYLGDRSNIFLINIGNNLPDCLGRKQIMVNSFKITLPYKAEHLFANLRPDQQVNVIYRFVTIVY
jgi:hypothetical protein